MKLSVSSKDPFSLLHHMVVLFCEEGANPLVNLPKQPAEIAALLQNAIKQQHFKGAAGKQLLVPATTAAKTPQILLVGLGKKPQEALSKVREAGAAASRQAKKTGAERVALLVGALPAKKNEAEGFSRALLEGFLLGLYSYRRFKTGNEEDQGGKVREGIVYSAGGAKEGAVWNITLKQAEAVVRGTNLARDLSNAPGNDMTPSRIGQEAQRVAKLGKFACKVFGPPEIKKEKMGGLLAVSQGSDQPPRFIILEYKGAKKKSDAPIVVVGKGITFDSGGISLKPAPNMDEMKHDMSGAAAVIGLFEALRDLRPKVNVVGIAACAENMPSGKAYRPGDVITTRSGKTVEILNTDAEGRMVLADALDYAGKYKPKAIIDLATLTGACVVALGNAAAGLMGNNESLKQKLREASDASGERVWPLPLYEDYTEAVKSQIADLKNTGGRDGGAVTAGAFLQEFVPAGAHWAHVDIAGTAWNSKGNGIFGKGATGFGVRLLAEFLLSQSK